MPEDGFRGLVRYEGGGGIIPALIVWSCLQLLVDVAFIARFCVCISEKKERFQDLMYILMMGMA